MREYLAAKGVVAICPCWRPRGSRSRRPTASRLPAPVSAIIGHIARHKLLKLLSETEQANGFANRFLGFRVRRSKVIADPVPVPADVLKALIDRMRTTVEFGKAAVGQRYCIVYRVERREVVVVIVAVGRWRLGTRATYTSRRKNCSA
jgi:hypothetical protein